MSISTLQAVMREHAERDSQETALHCWDGSLRTYHPVSYQTLTRRAFAFGAKIVQAGADSEVRGRVVMIACHTPYATLVAFYGAISVGAIPMIFPMPLSLGGHEALTERISHWGFSFERAAMLVLEEGLEEKFHQHVPSEITVLRLSDDPLAEVEEQAAPAVEHNPVPSDIAFFQTTSSSTGDHKAVAISHQNIIANVRGIRDAQNMSADERMATWLPLFHDMGLVGTVLFSFCNNYNLLIMTPTQFVKRPALWLKGMSDYQSTIATAPNFGFDYCSRLVSDKDANEMDLSNVKHLFIGAEPIRVSTVAGFINKFKVAGVSAQTIRPAYGLAESTIITSMTDPNSISRFICLDADAIAIGEPIKLLDTISFDDEQKLAAYDSNKAMAICAAGTAIDGMQIDIVDEQGNAVAGEGIAGEIAIKGTSVALGYVGGSDQLIQSFDQDFTLTGDLGVIVEGELFILERLKNIIIRNGENYLVSALEEQLAELLHISHEHIAVFDADIHNPQSDIVVLVERHAPIDQSEIDRLLVDMPKEAFPITKILLAKSREIPRTTSGKKRHFYCRKMFQKDEIKYQQCIEVSPQKIMQAQNRLRS